MIDYFALGLTHLLIVVALFRIVMRDELDREEPIATGAPEADGPALGDQMPTSRKRRERRPDA